MVFWVFGRVCVCFGELILGVKVLLKLSVMSSCFMWVSLCRVLIREDESGLGMV